MGFSVMLWGAEKLVPAEYWCPYGMYLNAYIVRTPTLCIRHVMHTYFVLKHRILYMQNRI